MKNIQQEIMGLEITDELITLNKRYQTLSELYDKYESLIEASDKACDNESVKILEKLQNKVYKKMRSITGQLKKDIFLSRMVKGALVMKQLKK